MTRSKTPAPLSAPVRPGDDPRLAAQAHARRGLKAGAQTLVDARVAYGEAQWSGEHDRRPEPGLLVRARL